MRVYEYTTVTICDSEYPGLSDSDIRELTAINAEMRLNGTINTNFFKWIGQNSIKFRHYVGFISLGEKSIEILPKIFRPHNNLTENNNAAFDSFVKMLSYVMEINMEEYKDDYQILQEQNAGLLDIIIFFFVVSLKRAIRKGLLNKYEQRDIVSQYLNGKIILERQLSTIVQTKLIQETYLHTSNTDLMKYFKTAISFFRSLTMKKFLKDELKKLAKHFEEVDFIPNHELKSRNYSFDRLSSYLENAFLQSKFILNAVSFSSTGHGKVRGVSILFDMNRIFENFITDVIKRNTSSMFPIEEIPLIREQNYSKWLFQEREQKKLRPDIQIIGKFSGRSEVQIIDTKYKELDGKDIVNDDEHSPIITDLYQMFAYSTKYMAANTVILYPSAKSGCKYYNSFSPNRKFMLWGVNLNLAGSKWEETLVNDLHDMMAIFYREDSFRSCR